MARWWCIECWSAFKQRTVATRMIEDDPYCAGCAVRLGFEAAPEVSGRTLGTAGNGMDSSPLAAPDAAASLKAGEAEISGGVSDLAGICDPEASPGSFAKAIKKTFLPKENKGEQVMPKIVTVDWETYDHLRPTHTTAAIAKQLGVGKSTLERHLAARSQNGKQRESAPKKKTATEKPEAEAGSVTIAVPESALDRFFARLPITRKVEIFTRELSSLEA